VDVVPRQVGPAESPETGGFYVVPETGAVPCGERSSSDAVRGVREHHPVIAVPGVPECAGSMTFGIPIAVNLLIGLGAQRRHL
jgi:hypothetical protein